IEQIARRDCVREGLIAVLSAVEPCVAISARRCPEEAFESGGTNAQVLASLPLLRAPHLGPMQFRFAELVSLYGGCLFKWTSLASQTDGRRGSGLLPRRQLLCCPAGSGVRPSLGRRSTAGRLASTARRTAPRSSSTP